MKGNKINIYRAENFVSAYNGHIKISEVYDDDDMLSMAISTLFTDFEYPDFSHLTVGEIWKRYLPAGLRQSPGNRFQGALRLPT